MDRRAHNQAYLDSIRRARLFRGPDGRYYSDHPDVNAIIQIESAGNARAKNKTSSATGLLQFVKGTGKDYGLVGQGFDNRWDPYASFEAGKRMWLKHGEELDKDGYWLDGGTTYTTHQQGLGGARQVLSNRLTAATRRNLDNNGGRGRSAAGFLQYWRDQIAKKSKIGVPQGAQLVDVPQHNQAVASAGLADVMGNYQNNAAVAQAHTPQASAIRSVVPETMDTQIGQVLQPAWAKVTGWNETPGNVFEDDILGQHLAVGPTQIRPQDLWTVTPNYTKRIV